MRLPRDLSGRDLARALRAVGYEETRQTGSHIRLTTTRNGEHHLTIPEHRQLRVGTLSAVLAEVSIHLGIGRADLIQILFGADKR